MTTTSRTVLLATLFAAGCGDKSAPDCTTLGRKLGAIELEERHGHLAEFMTARERDEVASRWTQKCESDRPTAAVRRCIAGARTTAEATACADSTKLANAVAGTASQARWVQVVGGPGAQGLEAVIVAADRDVIAAGYFGTSVPAVAGSQRLATLGATTLTSAGGEDIWVARLAPDGAPRWLTRLGSERGDMVGALAVTASGTVVVGPRSDGDVDYGDGTDYLLDALRAGIPKPVVIVTLAADGSVTRAYALPVGGVAESIGSLPDGDLVVATRAIELPRDRGFECGSPAYVLARVHEDGSLAWLRCNDAASRLAYTASEAPAQVAIGPGGTLAMCASFAGRMSWAGHVGEAPGEEEESSAFVVLLDGDGNVRWARYAYGDDILCEELAVTNDGIVAVRLDNFPAPHRVEIAGAEPASGPAVAAWSADGDPLWLRTCDELLGVQRCAIRSIVSVGDHLAVAARSGKDAVLAEIVSRTAEILDVRTVPAAALGRELVSYDGAFAFGTTTEAGADLGIGLPPQDTDGDAVIGVFEPSAQ